MKTNPNDAAFARPTDDMYATQIDKVAQTGLTKREYFAAMALQGLLANSEAVNWFDRTEDTIQETAVTCADALIAELNKGQE